MLDRQIDHQTVDDGWLVLLLHMDTRTTSCTVKENTHYTEGTVLFVLTAIFLYNLELARYHSCIRTCCLLLLLLRGDPFFER